MDDAVARLEELADEIEAAQQSGWWLTEPMKAGHLRAMRLSRRRRGLDNPRPDSSIRSTAAVPQWRLRIVDEPAAGSDPRFVAALAPSTPLIAWHGNVLAQVGGPEIAVDVIAELARQWGPEKHPDGSWGVVPARVGRNYDVVADGSRLRLHNVVAGTLLRTREAFSFQHGASGAATLTEVAERYRRLTRVLQAAARLGGRLESADDGLIVIAYEPT